MEGRQRARQEELREVGLPAPLFLDDRSIHDRAICTHEKAHSCTSTEFLVPHDWEAAQNFVGQWRTGNIAAEAHRRQVNR